METNTILRAALVGCCALTVALCGSVHHADIDLKIAAPQQRGDAASRITAIPAGFTPASLDEDESESGNETTFDNVSAEAADSIIDAGLRNGGRLLPLAKEFTIEALRRTAVTVGLPLFDLSEAERQINAIDSIVLDNALYDWAEVDLNQPTMIRVGVAYAYYLSGDEEGVFLLGHELTHVAAWGRDIEP